METYHYHEKSREKVEVRESEIQNESTEAATPAPSSVLSAPSSPSHEFSFTISLYSPATTKTTKSTSTTTSKAPSSPSSPSSSAKRASKAPPTSAIDLSPADEIFFHGHLLPLQFVPHPHASSSRPSTQSLDSLKLTETATQVDSSNEKSHNSADTTANATTAAVDSSSIPCSSTCEDDCSSRNKISSKSKSFSLFGLPKRKKYSETVTNNEKSENCNKRKLKFEVTQFLKRYLNMAKTLLSANKAGRRHTGSFGRHSNSYSVGPLDYSRDLMRGMRRGEFSAPASMRTSPTNSGRLLATAGVSSPVSESTMEEMQAAIQAAIAHCKYSISATHKDQDKDKVLELTSTVPVN